MATNQLGTTPGFVDKRVVQGNNGVGVIATPANYATTASRDTRLAAANAGYYTADLLNTMTENDKIYALRQIDDSAGI